MRALALPGVWGCFAALWTCGCGGRVLPLDGDGGSDAAAAADVSRISEHDTEAPGNSCPASAPREGQACSPAGFECEYGATQPNPSCGTLWECNMSGWGVVDGSPTSCPPLGAPCPDSYADVPVNNACPIMDQVCVYPTGSCGCTRPPSGGGQATWVCTALPPECPSPIPAVGSPCVSPGLSCAYSPCGGGRTIECVDGTWQLTTAVCQ